MPKICEFYGISIYIYYRDHAPSHFHGVYGEFDILIAIDDLRILEGAFPPRALGLVIEWASKHQDELRLAWNDAVEMQPLRKISPLL